MQAKIAIILFAIIVILITNPQKAYSEQKASGSSAILVPTSPIVKEDVRVKILTQYLKQFDSPLTPSAETFVKTADRYQLDWKLMVAISAVESTYGQQIPHNSYNAWGWGVYGDNVIRFSSFDEGIETVSKGLREQYINSWGVDDIYSIGKIYSASPTWAQRVEATMNRIERFAANNTATTLHISL